MASRPPYPSSLIPEFFRGQHRNARGDQHGREQRQRQNKGDIKVDPHNPQHQQDSKDQPHGKQTLRRGYDRLQVFREQLSSEGLLESHHEQVGWVPS